MIENIIILGDHIQALGVSRICKRLGLPVYLYNSSSVCLTRFSNSCDFFYPFQTNDDLLRMLETTPAACKSSLIMPTNDRMVEFLMQHYDLLVSKYWLSIPSPQVTSTCFDKIQTYKTAQRLSIPVPACFFPHSEADLAGVAAECSFPVIIKPSVMYKFYSQSGKKVVKCNNYDELRQNYRRVARIIDPQEIIIQEFLEGGAKNLFSYCSFTANGQSWGSFTAHRCRQKPMDFGVSTTFARAVVVHEIEELAKKFLTGIDYFGLSEVEFMFDEKTKNYRLLEINPRTWKWHSISNKLGINLIRMLIDYLNGRKMEIARNQREDIAWIERLTDTYVCLGEILKGHMTIREYAASLKIEKESAVLDKKDLLPALMYLVLVPYFYFKR